MTPENLTRTVTRVPVTDPKTPACPICGGELLQHPDYPRLYGCLKNQRHVFRVEGGELAEGGKLVAIWVKS